MSKTTFRPGKSLPFGEKTLALGNAQLNKPAIYAVTCKTSGRMYIGRSKSPDKRRAVHYYWLQQPEKEGTSNVYFNNEVLLGDVTNFGVDDFYMEFLFVFDEDVTVNEMRQKEFEIQSQFDRKWLYNSKIEDLSHYEPEEVKRRRAARARKILDEEPSLIALRKQLAEIAPLYQKEQVAIRALQVSHFNQRRECEMKVEAGIVPRTAYYALDKQFYRDMKAQKAIFKPLAAKFNQAKALLKTEVRLVKLFHKI